MPSTYTQHSHLNKCEWIIILRAIELLNSIPNCRPFEIVWVHFFVHRWRFGQFFASVSKYLIIFHFKIWSKVVVLCTLCGPFCSSFSLHCNYICTRGKCRYTCASQTDIGIGNMNYAKSTCSSLARSCNCHFPTASWIAYTLAYKINIHEITQPVVIRNPSKNGESSVAIAVVIVVVVVVSGIVSNAYIFVAHVSFCLAVVLFTITQMHTMHVFQFCVWRIHYDEFQWGLNWNQNRNRCVTKIMPFIVQVTVQSIVDSCWLLIDRI